MSVKPVSKTARYIVTGLAIALYIAGLILMFSNTYQGLALWLVSTVMGGTFVYVCKRREALIEKERAEQARDAQRKSQS